VFLESLAELLDAASQSLSGGLLVLVVGLGQVSGIDVALDGVYGGGDVVEVGLGLGRLERLVGVVKPALQRLCGDIGALGRVVLFSHV